MRHATIASLIQPVICGSAFRNKGVQPLIDAVIDYLPSPLEIRPVEGTNPDNGETVKRTSSDTEPWTASTGKPRPWRPSSDSARAATSSIPSTPSRGT